jgi:Tfp pilus assembly protein PilE
MKLGFSFLELIITILIILALLFMGFAALRDIIEKSRVAEARYVLGQLRNAQQALSMFTGESAQSVKELDVIAPDKCVPTHYFRYYLSSEGQRGVAERCIKGGRDPQARISYTLSLDFRTGEFKSK